MNARETVIGLRLDALDPLLFRDGRPFDAAARVSGGLPNPQTLAGALRTAMLAALGFDFGKFVAARKGGDISAALAAGGAPEWWMDVRVRGPWPAVGTTGSTVEPLFEKPATLYRSKAKAWDRAEPLNPNALPGWTGLLLPLWKRSEPDPKAEGGWLTLRALKQFLGRQTVPAEEIIGRNILFGDDDRIGIEIEKHALTSAEGMLYAVRFLSLDPKLRRYRDGRRQHYPARFDGGAACFYAEVMLPAEADKTDFFPAGTRTPVPLGGEGKYVAAARVTPCDWPDPTPPVGKAIWYLTSPAFLRGSPPLPTTGGTVLAAASGPGIAVSGWDVARNGPRPTRFAVPAGAVYFVDDPTRPEHDSLDPDPANRLEGWGFALPGSW